MKKAPLLITVGIIVLAAAGYYGYQTFFNKKLVTPWDLVPESAVAVFEPSACSECLEPVQSSSIWQLIHEGTFFEKNRDSIESIVGFLMKPKGGSLVSAHIISKDDFDFVFYVPITTPAERNLLDASLEAWKARQPRNFSVRLYNNVEIHDYSSSAGNFSWLLLDNVWIGSFTPFLVEDIVRVYGEGSGATFRNEIADVYKMPKMRNDAGNLYVHLAHLSEWLTVFVPEVSTEFIKTFGKAALLDVRGTDQSLVLNGFSLDDPTQGSVLSVFGDQTPTPFSLKSLVSNRTVLLASYGLSDGLNFQKRLTASSLRGTSVTDTLTRLAGEHKFDLSAMYGSIDDEIGICYVEKGSKELSKVMLIETGSPGTLTGAFEKLAAAYAEDTVFFEKYSTYEIREIPVFQFPAKLFKPFVSGFDRSYYTVAHNTIIIGDGLEELKRFLADIDREETWGKSVSQNRFLESTLLESNVSLYVNTPRTWNILSGMVTERWNRFIRQYRTQLTSAGMGAIQFSHLNQSFYTNVTWLYKDAPAIQRPTASSEVQVTHFNRNLVGKPFLVKSHVDKSDELLVQDSAMDVHLVSSAGKVLWSKRVDGKIVGDVFQIDYFKNGKLQYYFATPGALHIIDRLGNYVSPFPVSIKVKELEYSNLVDYDNSKNYRFLLADRSGKLWMYDKEGKNLEGWKPCNAEDALSTAPSHFRIKGKDYILAIRRDGRIYLYNRRGEKLKGFPLVLEARPEGDYFIEPGDTPAKSTVVIVSRDGFRIRFNLEGKVITRETLLKTTFEARFYLAKEKGGKSYVMVRQEPKGLTIFDANSSEIITNEFIGMNAATVSFYDFGAGRLYYTIEDATQELTYVYDAQFSLLTSPPWEGLYPIVKNKGNTQISVYVTEGNSVLLRTL